MYSLLIHIVVLVLDDFGSARNYMCSGRHVGAMYEENYQFSYPFTVNLMGHGHNVIQMQRLYIDNVIKGDAHLC